MSAEVVIKNSTVSNERREPNKIKRNKMSL